jgi:hypothetical protein
MLSDRLLTVRLRIRPACGKEQARDEHGAQKPVSVWPGTLRLPMHLRSAVAAVSSQRAAVFGRGSSSKFKGSLRRGR